MRKHLYRLIAVVAIVGFTFSCSTSKRTDKSGKTTDSIETTEIDSTYEDDSIANGKSLNDIRFANFTDKDWLDNEYIRTLRVYIDAFVNGKVKDDELELYKSDVKGDRKSVV